MTEKRYTIIHLGNPADCVIKDNTSNNTIGVFDSMHNPVNEVCDLLNEQEETIKELELENAKHIGDGEWDIRDITYCHGKFRLEEWGERYHQFYDGDKLLEDEEVVSLLFENEKLKEDKEFWKGDSCKCPNYLSILSMDCQIVQEAIWDLKKVIDVDTEAFKLLDELDDKFDELNQHRIEMYIRWYIR